MTIHEARHEPGPETAEIATLVSRARTAQAAFETGADQARYDRAALAAAWALMEPGRNRALAELAVATTGLGNVADKISKNHRKTLGLLRDIRDARTHGVIAEEPARGITRIARPIGVVGAVVPSTNPVATPANNAINALKCGNAILLAPSPKGAQAGTLLVDHMRAELRRAGLPADLVQMVPAPASKAKTQALMEAADLLIVTGSQDNVRRAYSSGTPAIGVGAGNVTVIVDETADLGAAAEKIARSKSFDNATSCSSENALVVVDAIYDAFLDALHAAGGRMLLGTEAHRLKAALFQRGGLNRRIIAKDLPEVIAASGITVRAPETARFLAIPGTGIGPEHPESGEKLSLVLTIYRAADFEAAARLTGQILAHQGAGHSVGLHSAEDSRARALAMSLPTCRVIVNQPHAIATGGSFDNGLPFSLSMGCGSWGGNSIDDNLHWRHFLNITKIVRPVPPEEPSLEDIFGAYWREHGQ